MSTGKKKNIHNNSNPSQSKKIKFIIPKNSLWIVQQRNGYRRWFPGDNHLQVQSSLQASNNTGILNTCTRLWLTESEQATPVVSIKDIVRSSRVRQTAEEGQRTYQPKRCGNEDEDNCPKSLMIKNQQASSQKFRQLKVNNYLLDTVFKIYYSFFSFIFLSLFISFLH